MERNIVKFENKDMGAEIRVIDRNGEPWFVAKDVCCALGIVNTPDAVGRLDEDERNTIVLNDGTPGNPGKTIVSESGLYNLIIRSDKPEAKAFKRWVTHEVLPSIRRHGAYMTPSTVDDLLTNPESIYVLAKALCDERERREIAEERLGAIRPRCPFGTPSTVNGLPRNKLIPSFWRSTKTTTVTTEITEYQRSLFEDPE